MKKQFLVSVSAALIITLISAHLFASNDRYLIVLKSKESTQRVKQLQALKASGKFKFTEMNIQPNSIHRLNLNSIETLPNINSIVTTIKDESELNQLQSSSEVALVEKEIFHAAPKPISSKGYIARNLISRLTLKGTPLPGYQGAPWGILAIKAPEAWSAVGSKGEGSRVLVLDTGLDLDHPNIKNNFEEGMNFVEEDLNSTNIQDSIGHGTHVSGTIAGTSDETGFTGVAPASKILMGRVCSESGCSNISIARGINWGIEKKVDIISMSLGGVYSTPGERLAIHNAEKSNIVVVAAAGNEGVGRVGYPAALNSVIAVGAVDSTLTKAIFSQWGPELDIVAPGVDVVSSVPRGSGRISLVQSITNGTPETLNSSILDGSKEIISPESNKLVFVGLGKPEDFADGSAMGKFALIKRGEISFADKVRNAINGGSTGVIIFNHEEGMIRGTLGDSKFDIPVIGIEKTSGESIVNQISNGLSVELSIQNIQTDYLPFDGTSMACPHVSGVVALMKAVNKNLTPSEIRTILTHTASPLSPNNKNQYGAGMINALAAVQAAQSQVQVD